MQKPMQFKTFIWPNNPTTYQISFHRNTIALQQPLGMWCVQELGGTARIFSGEGVFFGAHAYEDFRALSMLLYEGGAGALFHPQWMTVQAYLTDLELTQEPRENFVRYRFRFLESPEPVEAQT